MDVVIDIIKDIQGGLQYLQHFGGTKFLAWCAHHGAGGQDGGDSLAAAFAPYGKTKSLQEVNFKDRAIFGHACMSLLQTCSGTGAIPNTWTSQLSFPVCLTF